MYDERFREPEASTYAFGTNKRVIRSYTVGVIPPDEQIILLTKLVRERQVIQFLLKSTFSKIFEDFREHANLVNLSREKVSVLKEYKEHYDNHINESFRELKNALEINDREIGRYKKDKNVELLPDYSILKNKALRDQIKVNIENGYFSAREREIIAAKSILNLGEHFMPIDLDQVFY